MSYERNASEIITSLRFQAEKDHRETILEERRSANNVGLTMTPTSAMKQLVLHDDENGNSISNYNNKKIGKPTNLKNHSANTKYCPAGHVMASLDLSTRQRRLQIKNLLPSDVYPIVSCDVCSKDIEDKIAGCCGVCDIDICETCYSSGRTVSDLLAESREKHSTVASLSSNGEASMTFISTKEYCGAGHEMYGKVPTVTRQQFLQDLDGLVSLPPIRCDCCSRTIREEFIAGCCTECQLHFCDDCFMKGQSYEDVLHDHYVQWNKQQQNDLGSMITNDQFDPTPYDGPIQQRYNGVRPTYKGTGRVNYDDYPDPTIYGFTFTGSGPCVEFFEKVFEPQGTVRLNFYFTAGTAKTFLFHSKHGSRALFDKASRLSSKSYKKLLTDPFSYNNRCFKKRPKQAPKIQQVL